MPDDDEIVSFNKNITIKGEAADTTRVKKVYVSFYKESDDSVVIDHAEATGTSSWYYIFDSTCLSHLRCGPGRNLLLLCHNGRGLFGECQATFFYHFDDINSNLGSY